MGIKWKAPPDGTKDKQAVMCIECSFGCSFGCFEWLLTELEHQTENAAIIVFPVKVCVQAFGTHRRVVEQVHHIG